MKKNRLQVTNNRFFFFCRELISYLKWTLGNQKGKIGK